MPNETLLSTLRETRNEIVYERNERSRRLDKAKEILKEGCSNLKQAQDKDCIAVQADEDVKEKQRVLTDSLNGMTAKPQYLLDKVGRLQSEQRDTSRLRQETLEIVRNRQRELTQAEAALAVAQANLQAIEKDIAGIDAQIQEVQNS